MSLFGRGLHYYCKEGDVVDGGIVDSALIGGWN